MKRKLGIAVLVIIVIVLAGVGWIVLGPGPLDFAGGRTVALAEYKEANPTGVPASLASADPINAWLDRYLTPPAN